MKGASGFKLIEVCLVLCMTMPPSYNVRMGEYLRVLRSTEFGKEVEVRDLAKSWQPAALFDQARPS